MEQRLRHDDVPYMRRQRFLGTFLVEKWQRVGLKGGGANLYTQCFLPHTSVPPRPPFLLRWLATTASRALPRPEDKVQVTLGERATVPYPGFAHQQHHRWANNVVCQGGREQEVPEPRDFLVLGYGLGGCRNGYAFVRASTPSGTQLLTTCVRVRRSLPSLAFGNIVALRLKIT